MWSTLARESLALSVSLRVLNWKSQRRWWSLKHVSATLRHSRSSVWGRSSPADCRTVKRPHLPQELLECPWEKTWPKSFQHLKPAIERGRGRHIAMVTEIMSSSFATSVKLQSTLTASCQTLILAVHFLWRWRERFVELLHSSPALLTLPLSVTAGVICQMGPIGWALPFSPAHEKARD